MINAFGNNFVIYNTVTERLEGNGNLYRTERGARIAATKLMQQDITQPRIVMTHKEFTDEFDPIVTVRNMLASHPVQLRKSEVGGCCDPSTELYHCM